MGFFTGPVQVFGILAALPSRSPLRTRVYNFPRESGTIVSGFAGTVGAISQVRSGGEKGVAGR
jgi:hypothetical protein